MWREWDNRLSNVKLTSPVSLGKFYGGLWAVTKKFPGKFSFPGRMEKRKWEYYQINLIFPLPKSRIFSPLGSMLLGINVEKWLLFTTLAVTVFPYWSTLNKQFYSCITRTFQISERKSYLTFEWGVTKKVAQWLKAYAILAENPGLIPSTHMMVHNYSQL